MEPAVREAVVVNLFTLGSFLFYLGLDRTSQGPDFSRADCLYYMLVCIHMSCAWVLRWNQISMLKIVWSAARKDWVCMLMGSVCLLYFLSLYRSDVLFGFSSVEVRWLLKKPSHVRSCQKFAQDTNSGSLILVIHWEWTIPCHFMITVIEAEAREVFTDSFLTIFSNLL